MTIRRKLLRNIILINLFVPLFFGAVLREMLVQFFNPNFNRNIVERFLDSFRLNTYVMVIGFSAVVILLILRVLRPVFQFLKTGENADKARRAAINIPWLLIGYHVLMWTIGVTISYAFIFHWDPPGGISYVMSLANSVSTALITGLISALMINIALLPTKKELAMTDIRSGEQDLFRRWRDYILALGIALNLGVFADLMAQFYQKAETVPVFLKHTAVGSILITGSYGLVFAVMIYLTRREDRWQASQIIERLSDLNAAGGDLSQRVTLYNFDDVGRIGHGFNQLLDTLTGMIGDIGGSSQNLKATGEELSSSAQSVADSLGESQAQLGAVTEHLDQQSQRVAESNVSVDHISASLGTLDRQIDDQAATVAQSSAAVEEMIGNFASITATLQRTRGLFDALLETAEKGQERITGTVKGIEEVQEQAGRLEEANRLIAGISARTNLLAMNAAIEAAHAGDAGRGFAVVADEIRKLAESSSLQSKDVGSSLAATGQLIDQVTKEVMITRDAFEDLREKVGETHVLQGQVLQSMEEQEAGGREVLEGLSRMKDITGTVQDTATAVTRDSSSIRSGMKELDDFSAKIHHAMDLFSAGNKAIQESLERINALSADNAENIDAIAGKVGRFKVG